MNDIVIAVLIVWATLAIPSIAHGVVLAQRAGRFVGLAFIACLLLPWIGLLFFRAQPLGTKRIVGIGYYCVSMLVISAVMAAISIFLPWVVASPSIIGGDGTYGPTDVMLFAVFAGVWVLCLIAGAMGITRGGDMIVGIVLGIVVALATGVLLGLVKVWGSAGLFLPEFRQKQAFIEQNVDIGSGGWVAFIALIVAYLCVTLLPFGLRLDRMPEQELAAQPPQPGEGAQSSPPLSDTGQFGGSFVGQQGPVQQPTSQWPTSSGAGW